MNRTFKGVWFPKEVWLCEELSFIEKGLIVEIDSLDGKDHCFASNEYFAEFFGCSVATIKRALFNLRKNGWIDDLKTDGRHRYIKSNLINKLPVIGASSQLKMSQQPAQNEPHNNTTNNPINFNTRKTIFESGEEASEYEGAFNEIWSAYDLGAHRGGFREGLIAYVEAMERKEVSHEALLEAVRNYCTYCKAMKKEEYAYSLKRFVEGQFYKNKFESAIVAPEPTNACDRYVATLARRQKIYDEMIAKGETPDWTPENFETC